MTLYLNKFFLLIFWGILVLLCLSCRPDVEKHSLEVTATAYTSHQDQTLGDPLVAAWGDKLKPEINAIAVSRDLLDSGLNYGVMVNIKGLPGKYRVTDKMHSRWEKKIDIYMGEELEKAREWGVRTVTITWENPTR